jgi:hypothetical protein
MRIKYNMDAGPGGGGAPPTSWTDSLPPEMRDDPIIKQVPDVQTLAKNYMHAQRLIGAKRVEQPSPQWDDKKWDSFYTSIGRPETPDKYTLPEVKFEDGAQWDEKNLSDAKTFFHKNGLTDRQAKATLEYYAGLVNNQSKTTKEATEAKRAGAMQVLQAEFGEKMQNKIDTAKAVIRKFGDDELFKYLDSSELGNNPGLVRALAKMGEAMMEDSSRGGGGAGAELNISNSSRALTEITKLRSDAEFIAKLYDKQAPGHVDTVARWQQLHKIAYPNKAE